MIEVLKQALEALERSVATCFDQYAHQQVMSQPNHFINQTITSLRQAIAELESQEPVAWLHTKIDGVAVPHRPSDLDKHPERWEALYKTPPPCPTCEALARTVMLDQTSHDTRPQRTKIVFPTMLRKMWSGSEVQAWLDESVNKEQA